jgi:hypothetical protein
MPAWFDNRTDLTAFLRYLAEECQFSALDLCRVVEKPGNWTREYEAWRGTFGSPAALQAALEGAGK